MLVIGVGHRDRGDDGVGPFVADLVIGRGGRGLIAEGNLADLSMRWERDDDVVIVDAVVTGAAPGTIHELDADALPRRSSATSTHEFGVADAIDLATMIDRRPVSLRVIGIELACVELGAGLSEAVEVAGRRVAADLVRSSHEQRPVTVS